jgi:hypothetical protein
MSPIPSSPAQEAAALRARALALRRLATRAEQADLHAVRRLAGDDTWVGATAQACRDDIVTSERRLAEAVDELRRHAVVLDRRAEQLLAATVVNRS